MIASAGEELSTLLDFFMMKDLDDEKEEKKQRISDGDFRRSKKNTGSETTGALKVSSEARRIVSAPAVLGVYQKKKKEEEGEQPQKKREESVQQKEQQQDQERDSEPDQSCRALECGRDGLEEVLTVGEFMTCQNPGATASSPSQGGCIGANTQTMFCDSSSNSRAKNQMVTTTRTPRALILHTIRKGKDMKLAAKQYFKNMVGPDGFEEYETIQDFFTCQNPAPSPTEKTHKGAIDPPIDTTNEDLVPTLECFSPTAAANYDPDNLSSKKAIPESNMDAVLGCLSPAAVRDNSCQESADIYNFEKSYNSLLTRGAKTRSTASGRSKNKGQSSINGATTGVGGSREPLDNTRDTSRGREPPSYHLYDDVSDTMSVEDEIKVLRDFLTCEAPDRPPSNTSVMDTMICRAGGDHDGDENIEDITKFHSYEMHQRVHNLFVCNNQKHRVACPTTTAFGSHGDDDDDRGSTSGGWITSSAAAAEAASSMVGTRTSSSNSKSTNDKKKSTRGLVLMNTIMTSRGAVESTSSSSKNKNNGSGRRKTGGGGGGGKASNDEMSTSNKSKASSRSKSLGGIPTRVGVSDHVGGHVSSMDDSTNDNATKTDESEDAGVMILVVRRPKNKKCILD